MDMHGGQGSRVVGVLALGVILAAATAEAGTSADTRCLLASGKAASKCVKDYTKAVGACLDQADAACETSLRADGGTLDRLLAGTEQPTRKGCAAESADDEHLAIP